MHLQDIFNARHACQQRRIGMELEQLRQFLKVAELGNFTRAAEAAGLSQGDKGTA
jgi:hypothetical protein